MTTTKAPAPVPAATAAMEETTSRPARKTARQLWRTTSRHHPAPRKVPAIIKGSDPVTARSLDCVCYFYLWSGDNGMGWIGVLNGDFYPIHYNRVRVLYSMGFYA